MKALLLSILSAAIIGSVSCFAPGTLRLNPPINAANTFATGRGRGAFGDDDDASKSTSRLFLSKTNESANNIEKTPPPDKDKLTKRYKIGSILFGLVSVILATMPDRTKAVKLGSKYAGSAGYGLAAGTCHILADATSNDRLSSDTYKRLNGGLFFFCFISLFAIPGEAAFHPQFGPAILLMMAMAFMKGWGCSVAYEGWKTGVEESSGRNASVTAKQLAAEFGHGIKSTASGIFRTPRKGFVYLLYLLVVLAGGFSAVMEAQFYMKYSAPLFDISLQWSAFARLALVSSMVYSLKDAAERGRLTGTTFIQMNFMVALWALAVAIGQGMYRRGLSFSKSPMLLMSIPFLYGGIRSLYTKSNARPPPPPKLEIPKSDVSPLKSSTELDDETTPLQSDSSSNELPSLSDSDKESEGSLESEKQSDSDGNTDEQEGDSDDTDDDTEDQSDPKQS